MPSRGRRRRRKGKDATPEGVARATRSSASPDSVSRATRSATKAEKLFKKDPPPRPLFASKKLSKKAAPRPLTLTDSPVSIVDIVESATKPSESDGQQESMEQKSPPPSNLVASPTSQGISTLSPGDTQVTAGTPIPAGATKETLNLNDSLDAVKGFVDITDSPIVSEVCRVNRGSKKPIFGRSQLREFTYPDRTWSTVERPTPGPTDIEDDAYEDPYRDFPTEEWDPPKIQQHVGGFYLQEILGAIDVPDWLQQDYVAFYTEWSQRGQGQYDDDSDYFPVYFPPGEQSRLYSYFRCKKGDWSWDTADHRRKCIIACWKLFHPGSYYLWCDEKIAANPKKYKKMNSPMFQRF
jgi:hypothetical protein